MIQITDNICLLEPEEEDVPGKVVVRLLPASPDYMIHHMTVFGQGWHESTQRFLSKVDELVKPGMRVLDFGAGTGILAIAAAKMGAVVTACEIDPWAIMLCQNNAVLNRVSLTLATGVEGQFDLILANVGIPVDFLNDHLTDGGTLIHE